MTLAVFHDFPGTVVTLVWVVLCGWQVKLCEPFVRHGPYLSTFEVQPTTWQSCYLTLL